MSWERTLVMFQCRMFVASWTGVVKYHGPRPVNRPNNVWVCNHTSMIDYIILTAYSPFAVIMQLHAGWIAFIQTRVLSCLGCLWFNRNEVSNNHDGIALGEALAHVSSVTDSPQMRLESFLASHAHCCSNKLALSLFNVDRAPLCQCDADGCCLQSQQAALQLSVQLSWADSAG